MLLQQLFSGSLSPLFLFQEDDCASAYFKMDNVLIDDRRIHVDFSQSVSKLDWVKNRKYQASKVSLLEHYTVWSMG